MVIDVTNYEVYRIITDAETKMELQKRLWLKICEHFGILNKLSLVTENFNVVDNIYIPAEYIPLSLSTSPPSLPSPSTSTSSPPLPPSSSSSSAAASSPSSSSSSPSAFILFIPKELNFIRESVSDITARFQSRIGYHKFLISDYDQFPLRNIIFPKISSSMENDDHPIKCWAILRFLNMGKGGGGGNNHHHHHHRRQREFSDIKSHLESLFPQLKIKIDLEKYDWLENCGLRMKIYPRMPCFFDLVKDDGGGERGERKDTLKMMILRLGYRNCVHHIEADTYHAFHSNITKVVNSIRLKEDYAREVLKCCGDRLNEYANLIGYYVEVSKITRMPFPLLDSIKERANQIWLDNDIINNKENNTIAAAAIINNNNNNNNNNNIDKCDDAITIAFFTHETEKLYKILKRPEIYDELEIKREEQMEKRIKKMVDDFERKYSVPTRKNQHEFAFVNRTLNFYEKIILFCQNLKKECSSCNYQRKSGDFLYSVGELNYFNEESGYCYTSNRSNCANKIQLGVRCPLGKRISVNFIMEDGTRVCFTDETYKIRLCCVFDALQKGVAGLNFTNKRYKNLIRDFRIIWPLEKELRRLHPSIFNDSRNWCLLNSFNNLDILLV